MKLILTCCIAVIVPTLYFSTGDSVTNFPKNPANYNLNLKANDNGDPKIFQETKILINEFSKIVENDLGGVMSLEEKRIKMQESGLKLKID